MTLADWASIANIVQLPVALYGVYLVIKTRQEVHISRTTIEKLNHNFIQLAALYMPMRFTGGAGGAGGAGGSAEGPNAVAGDGGHGGHGGGGLHS
jgi:uncharacterized membrane protein YgcG